MPCLLHNVLELPAAQYNLPHRYLLTAKKKIYAMKKIIISQVLTLMEKWRRCFAYNEVCDGQQEKQNEETDCKASFAPSETCAVELILIHRHVSSPEIAVVFFVNFPSFHGLLSHRQMARTAVGLPCCTQPNERMQQQHGSFTQDTVMQVRLYNSSTSISENK